MLQEKPNGNLIKSKVQKVISEELDNISYFKILSKLKKEARARFLSCCGPQGSFVFKAPLGKARGFRATNVEFCCYLSLRLGLENIAQDGEKCIECHQKLEKDGYHTMICKTGKYGPVQRHDEQRDVVYDYLVKAMAKPKKELRVHSATKKTPSDIYLPAGCDGKKTSLDFTIIHPQATKFIDGASKFENYAIDIAEKKKCSKYSQDCANEGVNFVPMAMEIYGKTSAKMKSMIEWISTGVGNRTGASRSTVIKEINRKMQFHLLRSISRAIQSRVPSRRIH